MAPGSEKNRGLRFERVAEAFLTAARENDLGIHRKWTRVSEFHKLLHQKGMRGGRAAEIRGIRYRVNGQEFNAHLQPGGQRLGTLQQVARQGKIGVRYHQFNFTGEGICSQLAWVNPKFATTFHDSRVEADP